jgi:hypothetical protein
MHTFEIEKQAPSEYPILALEIFSGGGADLGNPFIWPIAGTLAGAPGLTASFWLQ